VVVEGPAGIGKSRLLGAAREQALAMGMVALWARATELEAGYSFGVVRQLFEPVLARSEDVEALFAGAAGLARQVVDPAAFSPSRPVDEFAVFHGLYWLAANVAERAGVVLTVDDVQWCDPARGRELWCGQRERLSGLGLGYWPQSLRKPPSHLRLPNPDRVGELFL
jgi:hypothetical protein